jgi:hypothetical protein
MSCGWRPTCSRQGRKQRCACSARHSKCSQNGRTFSNRHGPVDHRHYQYVPTFILRGLTELHLEFTLAEAAPSPEHAITEQ